MIIIFYTRIQSTLYSINGLCNKWTEKIKETMIFIWCGDWERCSSKAYKLSSSFSLSTLFRDLYNWAFANNIWISFLEAIFLYPSDTPFLKLSLLFTDMMIIKARNNKVFSDISKGSKDIIDEVKVVSWKWSADRLKIPPCLFYEWSMEPLICMNS
jgi:hypothetical protein